MTLRKVGYPTEVNVSLLEEMALKEFGRMDFRTASDHDCHDAEMIVDAGFAKWISSTMRARVTLQGYQYLSEKQAEQAKDMDEGIVERNDDPEKPEISTSGLMRVRKTGKLPFEDLHENLQKASVIHFRSLVENLQDAQIRPLSNAYERLQKVATIHLGRFTESLHSISTSYLRDLTNALLLEKGEELKK